MPPAVLAAINGHILRADVHDARIRRMDLERPHDRLIAWEVHPLPGVAGIRAAIGPGLRASEHHARLRGCNVTQRTSTSSGKPRSRVVQVPVSVAKRYSPRLHLAGSLPPQSAAPA